MFRDISLKSKIAFVFFVTGKMTSLPAVYFIFSGDSDKAFLMACIYSGLILLSIIFSLLSIKDKKSGIRIVEECIKKKGTHTFKVVNGKVTMIE
tara:strand:- start:4538 stop:4819 length:282 start_codon:yes stop_codon:yes gene_type:complete